jgi:hypothetical protein
VPKIITHKNQINRMQINNEAEVVQSILINVVLNADFVQNLCHRIEGRLLAGSTPRRYDLGFLHDRSKR